MAGIAAVTMGNQSCNQQTVQTPTTRVLKKTVRLDAITSYNFMIPGGGSFDFRSVMNWQIQQLMMDSQLYVIPEPDAMLNSSNTVLARADADAIRDHIVAAQRRIAAATAPTATSGTPDPTADQTQPACLQDLPQLIIDGQVNSFEADGGGGLSIGFTSAGSFGASANFQVSSAQLDVGLRARDPFFGYVLGMADGQADQSSTQVGFSINFALLSLSPDYYFTTPLVNVSQSALTNALNALDTAISTQDQQEGIPVWEGQVDQGTQNDNNFIRINAGQIEGVLPGDTFDIYNVHTQWAGQPCQSALTLREATTSEPIATVQISSAPGDLGINYSYAQIIKSTGAQIYPGAMVYINTLVPPPTTSSSSSGSSSSSSSNASTGN